MTNKKGSNDDTKERQRELRSRVRPDITPLILELTEATLDRGLKWEPTTSSGFITTIGTQTFKVYEASDPEPPYPTYTVLAILDAKGKQLWRETGGDVNSLYKAVKRKTHGVDEVIKESLAELRKLYPK